MIDLLKIQTAVWALTAGTAAGLYSVRLYKSRRFRFFRQLSPNLLRAGRGAIPASGAAEKAQNLHLVLIYN